MRAIALAILIAGLNIANEIHNWISPTTDSTSLFRAFLMFCLGCWLGKEILSIPRRKT